MQNLPSQQSIVRTDYTLKYYRVDELLQAHQTLKISGAHSNIFVRSWLAYSLVRQDVIIPWLSGDFEALLKVFSQVHKESVADAQALTAILLRETKDKKIIFAVNLNQVDAGQFSLLIDVISQINSTSKASKAGGNSEQLVEASAGLLVNLVIWSPQGEDSLLGYQSILSQVTERLDVGGAVEQLPQKSNKSKAFALCALLVIGSATYWQLSKPESVEETALAEQGAVGEKNKLAAAAVVVAKEAEAGNIQQADQSLSSVKAVGEGEGSEVKLEVAESETEQSRAAPSQEIQPVVVPLGDNFETIKITEVGSAQGVNIGSSIKTAKGALSIGDAKSGLSAVDDKVEKVVDAWVSAWAQQKFDLYSTHYIDTFSARKNMSHKQWLDWRRKRIEKPKWIKLSRSNIKHVGASDAKIYSITFTLNYASPNYSDKTFKRLGLTLIGDEYKIISEENLKVTKN